MRRVIWLGLVASFAGLVAVPAPGASAQGAVVFNATVNVNCSGCGDSTGTASICVTGEVNGDATAVCVYPTPRRLLAGNTSASFTVNEPGGLNCLVAGTASGVTTGALNVAFNWTRLGNVVLISTAGDINGSGTANYLVTSPTGIPCGGPVTATMSGSIAGL